MVFSYSFYFVSIWSTGVLAFPACVALAVLAIVFRDDESTVVVLSVASVLSLLWAIYLRNHSSRVLIRSGAWPLACTRYDLVARKDPAGITQTYQNIKEWANYVSDFYSRPPRLVGSGWAYFLKRAGPSDPRLFLHNLTGPTGDERTWYGGTTIAAVNRWAKGRGKTLGAHPTMDFISLSSWFALGNHGNAGDSGVTTKDAFEKATCLDMTSLEGPFVVDSYDKLREMFDGVERAIYVVLDVTLSINVFKENIDVIKTGLVIDSAHVAAEWLNTGALLRVAFMGAARDNAVGIRWTAYQQIDKYDHLDPHPCSKTCQFFQTDVLSACGGCVETMRKFRTRSSLAYANAWMPGISPVQTISVVVTGHINFEIIFKMPDGILTGESLWKLIKGMNSVHYLHGGRSEVRYAGSNEYNLVYLDISMRKSGFRAPFELLGNMNVTRVALHAGKFDTISTSPLQRVSLHDVAGGKPSTVV